MTSGPRVDPELLLSRLSYSHFAELMTIEEQEERAFYEIECVRGAWSVRELKRQIGALYFERSAFSRDPHRLAGLLQADAAALEPKLSFRDPYVFEFLGLRPPEVMGESDLEDALLDRLQAFMLELGHGFCFEARQKRIQTVRRSAFSCASARTTRSSITHSQTYQTRYSCQSIKWSYQLWTSCGIFLTLRQQTSARANVARSSLSNSEKRGCDPSAFGQERTRNECFSRAETGHPPPDVLLDEPMHKRVRSGARGWGLDRGIKRISGSVIGTGGE
jgi:predicted nuclease of restriction endonuclease-like (RecB) superfamily